MNRTRRTGPIQENEPAVFLDRKDREYLVRLDPRRPVSIRGGTIAVADVIGREEGSVVRSSHNEPFLVFRPTLPQLVPNLPRTAQAIYPKDLGTISVWADLFPGARVVEAGVGAGALTIALLSAVGGDGQVMSYEVRDDFAELARKNVARYFGPAPNWSIEVGDVAERLDAKNVDRVLLDLPEPWHVIDRAWTALRPGGILLCYLPTVVQVKTLVDALRNDNRFACLETSETLMRLWHVKGMSMRPQHRMVAHTGFITTARRLADGQHDLPRPP